MPLHHHHHAGPEERNRYLKIGCINLVTVTVELVMSLGGSLALRTDGLHGASDLCENGMNAYIAERARHMENPRKLRQIGFIGSLVLIGLSTLLMLVEARERMASSEPILFAHWSVLVACFALGMNWWQYQIHVNAPEHDHNDTYEGQLIHLIQDIAASVAAIIGTALAVFTDFAKADAWATFVIIGIIWYRMFKGYQTVFDHP